MKKIIWILCVLLYLNSCSNSEQKFEGTFENIEDNSQTLIKKISDKEYEVSSVFNPELNFKVKRDGNSLSGRFEGVPIEIIYNNTLDTIINKASDKVVFTCKRVK